MSSTALARACLALALVASLAGAWFVALRVRRDAAVPPSPPPPQATREERGAVPGLAGETQLASGAQLAVRLVRLHASASDQAFDARELRTRLHLTAGEPFVCELRLLGAASDAEIDLAHLRVVDEDGEALAPFVVHDSLQPGSLADPLETLLAPPPDALRVGQSISIVLWGREPKSSSSPGSLLSRVLLTGVHAAGQPGSFEVALSGASLPHGDVDTALARVGAASRAPAAKVDGR